MSRKIALLYVVSIFAIGCMQGHFPTGGEVEVLEMVEPVLFFDVPQETSEVSCDDIVLMIAQILQAHERKNPFTVAPLMIRASSMGSLAGLDEREDCPTPSLSGSVRFDFEEDCPTPSSRLNRTLSMVFQRGIDGRSAPMRRSVSDGSLSAQVGSGDRSSGLRISIPVAAGEPKDCPTPSYFNADD